MCKHHTEVTADASFQENWLPPSAPSPNFPQNPPTRKKQLQKRGAALFWNQLPSVTGEVDILMVYPKQSLSPKSLGTCFSSPLSLRLCEYRRVELPVMAVVPRSSVSPSPHDHHGTGSQKPLIPLLGSICVNTEQINKY